MSFLINQRGIPTLFTTHLIWQLGILIALTIPQTGSSQAPTWQWVNGYCTEVGTTYWNTVATDKAGNTYYAAPFSTSSIVFGSQTIHQIGLTDFYVVKYDSSGTVIWAKAFGGAREDEVRGLVVDNSCNVYLGGSFRSSVLSFDNHLLNNTDSLGNIFIAKLDSSGHCVWARSGGGAGQEGIYNISCDSTNKIYLTGIVGNCPTLTLDTCSVTFSNGSGLFIAQYDTVGTIRWLRNAQCTTNCYMDEPFDITCDNSGAYLVGSMRSPALDWGDTVLYNSDNTNGSSDIFLIKYDTTGNILWAQAIGSSGGNDIGRALKADGKGNLYLGGSFDQSDLTVGNVFMSNSSNQSYKFDAFLAKLNSSGDVLWAKSSNGPQSEYVGSIGIAPGGRPVVAYESAGPVTFDSIYFSHDPSYIPYICLLKYDTSGSEILGRNIRGLAWKSISGISADNKSNVYLTGYYLGTDSVVLGSLYLQETGACYIHTFITKLGIYGPQDIDLHRAPDQVSIWPNPAHENCAISINSGSEYLVEIYETNGKKVTSQNATRQTDIRTTDLPTGIYILVIKTSDGVIRRKLAIAH